MKNMLKVLSTTIFLVSIGATASASLPGELKSVIGEARSHHASDYLQLKNLENLAPGSYLKARVQKPTAARAMKRLQIHEGVLLEALLMPSLDLVPDQTFPAQMPETQRSTWRQEVLDALQVGAAAALTHRQTPHAEAALAFTLSNQTFVGIWAPVCIFYGRVARHAQGVAKLTAIAELSSGTVQESAIIGLGKTRQPEAFVVLQSLLEAPGKSKLHKTVLHALGHLANRAAQKANPMENDMLIRLRVKEALVRRIDRPTPLLHENVALTSLALTLRPHELTQVQKQMVEERARGLVTPILSGMQRKAFPR